MTDDPKTAPADASPAACRALTIPPRTEEGVRPMAGFVAQLIACNARMAPFRRARREEPAGAMVAYGSNAGRGAAHLAIDLKV